MPDCLLFMLFLWDGADRLAEEDGRELVCLLNFAGEFVHVHMDREGSYTELMYGSRYDGLRDVELWPNGFAWLLRN